MTIDIKELSKEDLNKKIEAIKAERERTANALKRYEEELEQRKQKVPLGVPFIAEKGEDFWYINPGTGVRLTTNNWTDAHQGLERNLNMFRSQDSVYKHAEMLLAWRKALVANSKGEPIDIKVLLPLLRKGWVAMDKSGNWWWYSGMPIKDYTLWRSGYKGTRCALSAFNLKPAENWETSLMECGL